MGTKAFRSTLRTHSMLSQVPETVTKWYKNYIPHVDPVENHKGFKTFSEFHPLCNDEVTAWKSGSSGSPSSLNFWFHK